MRSLLFLAALAAGCAAGPTREQLEGSWKLVRVNGEIRHGVVRDALHRDAEVIITFRPDGTWSSTTSTGAACLRLWPWVLEGSSLRRTLGAQSESARVRLLGGELWIAPDLLLEPPVTGDAREGRYARSHAPPLPPCSAPTPR